MTTVIRLSLGKILVNLFLQVVKRTNMLVYVLVFMPARKSDV